MRFRFHDETSDRDYWVDGLTCTEEEWCEAVEGGMAHDIEEKFGVHDVLYDTHVFDRDDVNYVGFSSYEIEEDQFPALMESWRQEYMRRGWLI